MAVSNKVDATMIAADVATDVSDQSNSGFSRKLAASDKRTRDHGITVVTKWLKSRPEVSETELRKIWKGLFYCLWHTDKEAVQTELSISISQILLSLHTSMAIDFFRTFQLTMRREWSGIDRLRMDKFYTLLRKFVSAVFQFLHRESFDPSTVKLFMDCFQEGTLLPADKFGALGIKLHMADIYLEELGLVTQIQKTPFFSLLKPFMVTLALDGDKTLVTRIDQGVFQPLLEATRSATEGVREGNELTEGGAAGAGLEGGLSSQDVALISEQLFDLASSSTTVEKNRKLLYRIQSDFAQLAKSLPVSAGNPLAACSSGGKSAKKLEKVEAGDEAKTIAEGVSEEEDAATLLPARGKSPKKGKNGKGVQTSGTLDKKGSKEGKDASKDERADTAVLVPTVSTSDKKKRKKSPEVEGVSEGVVVKKGKVRASTMSATTTQEESGTGGKVKGSGRKGKAGVAPGGMSDSESEMGASLLPPLLDTAEPITAVPDTLKEAVTNPTGGTKGVVAGKAGGEAAVSNLEGLFKAVTAQGESPIASGTRLRRKAAQVERVVGDGEAGEAGEEGAAPPPAKKAKGGQKVAKGISSEKAAKVSGVSGAGKRGGEGPAETVVGDAGARGKSEPVLKRKRLVRFSLQANLFFAKSGPVPPPSLRTPPSATPRGSALKKGVKAGPVNLKLLKAPEELLGTREIKVRGSPALVTMRNGRGGGRGGRATKVMSRMGVKKRSPS